MERRKLKVVRPKTTSNAIEQASLEDIKRMFKTGNFDFMPSTE